MSTSGMHRRPFEVRHLVRNAYHNITSLILEYAPREELIFSIQSNFLCFCIIHVSTNY